MVLILSKIKQSSPVDWSNFDEKLTGFVGETFMVLMKSELGNVYRSN